MARRAGENRITSIPAIHGKLTYDGKISEPDVAWTIEKWLERHHEINNRQGHIRAVRGQSVLRQLKLEFVADRVILRTKGGSQDDPIPTTIYCGRESGGGATAPGGQSASF